MTLVIVYAVAALLLTSLAVLPASEFRGFSSDEKYAIVTIVLGSAWPMICTFLVGPLLLGTPDSILFPGLWYLPAAVMVMLIIGRNVNNRDCVVDLPVILLMTLAPISLLGLTAGHLTPSTLMRWGLAVLLLCGVVLKGRAISVNAVACGCRLALLCTAASVVVAIFLSPGIVTDCRIDKCGSAGLVLTSPFAGNGNILGLSVVLMLPLAMFGISRRRAILLIPAVVLLGELAGSRTAFIGLAAAAVAFGCYRLAPLSLRSAALGACLLGAAGLSLAPAVLVYGDGAFSYRGALWNDAKSMIAEHPVMGHGPVAWEHLNTSSLFVANYSPHNAWLDFGVSVGIWGTIVVVAAIVLKIVFVRGEERAAIIVYFTCVLATSTLESVFVPYFIGIAPFAVILPMFIGPGRIVIDKEKMTMFSNKGRLNVALARRPEEVS
ncbi:O-antigen ligase family protein [Gordonia sputi]